MIRRFTLLFSLAVLPLLAFWIQAADPTDPARAAFEQGNSLLRDARQACAYHAPDLLRQAAEQYRTCLASPANSLDAGNLFTAARHNLELTKLLLAQEPSPEKANGGEGQKTRGSKAKEENGANQDGTDDPFSPANRKEDPAKAKEGASPQSEAAKEGTSAKTEASKESTGWNDRPQREPAAKQAEKSAAHEPHPFDPHCPT
ncbi:MAG TPA: hypothetical protein VFA18_09755 [Gemmataceae bacterium]|nr:hypothetical protein [Gemmataceae bacterium]